MVSSTPPVAPPATPAPPAAPVTAPTRLYTGTGAPRFEHFDVAHNQEHTAGQGIYLTDSHAIAQAYARRRTANQPGAQPRVVAADVPQANWFDSRPYHNRLSPALQQGWQQRLSSISTDATRPWFHHAAAQQAMEALRTPDTQISHVAKYFPREFRQHMLDQGYHGMILGEGGEGHVSAPETYIPQHTSYVLYDHDLAHIADHQAPPPADEVVQKAFYAGSPPTDGADPASTEGRFTGTEGMEPSHQPQHPGIRGGIGYYDANGRWHYGTPHAVGLREHDEDESSSPPPPPTMSQDEPEAAPAATPALDEVLRAAPAAVADSLATIAARYTSTPPRYAAPQLDAPLVPGLASKRVLLYAEFPDDPPGPDGKPSGWWFEVIENQCQTCVFFEPMLKSQDGRPHCHNAQISASQFQATVALRDACTGYHAGLDPARLWRDRARTVPDQYNRRLLSALIDAKLAEGTPPLRVGKTEVYPYTDEDAERAFEQNQATWDNLVSHRLTGQGYDPDDVPKPRKVEGERIDQAARAALAPPKPAQKRK